MNYTKERYPAELKDLDTLPQGRFLYCIRSYFTDKMFWQNSVSWMLGVDVNSDKLEKKYLSRVAEVEKIQEHLPQNVRFWRRILCNSLQKITDVVGQVTTAENEVLAVLFTGSSAQGLSLPYKSDLDLRLVVEKAADVHRIFEQFLKRFRESVLHDSLSEWQDKIREAGEKGELTDELLVLPYDMFDFGFPDMQFVDGDATGSRLPVQFASGHLFSLEYLEKLLSDPPSPKKFQHIVEFGGMPELITLQLQQHTLHQLAFSSVIATSENELTQTLDQLQNSAQKLIRSYAPKRW